MAGIQAGKLNRRIDFYKPVETIDDAGQPVPNYVYDFSAMAAVRPVRGMERAKFGRVEAATMLFDFKIYYTEKLMVTHIVKFNGSFFDVQNFSPMGNLNRRFIDFMGELIEASKIVVP